MKIYFLIFNFCVFGYFLSAKYINTFLVDANFLNIYNISYNEEYILNNEDLNSTGIYFFKIKKENKERNGIIKLKINKEAYPDRNMEVNILEYNEEPISEYDYNKYINLQELLLDSKTTDKKYSTYGYLFKTNKNTTYLVFNITIDKKMDYFSIYICPDEDGEQSEEEEDNIPDGSQNKTDNKNNSEQLNSKTFTIFIINVSIVAFLVLLYGICKKCDCCDCCDCYGCC